MHVLFVTCNLTRLINKDRQLVLYDIVPFIHARTHARTWTKFPQAVHGQRTDARPSLDFLAILDFSFLQYCRCSRGWREGKKERGEGRGAKEGLSDFFAPSPLLHCQRSSCTYGVPHGKHT